jgi:hypothetical protein
MKKIKNRGRRTERRFFLELSSSRGQQNEKKQKSWGRNFRATVSLSNPKIKREKKKGKGKRPGKKKRN